MNKLMKKICIAIIIAIILTTTLLMSIKIMAYRNAMKEGAIWSNSGECELVTYIPDYRSYGGVGRVFRMFSNQSFFVVYNKSGEQLKNSALYFWQAQFSDLMAPEWHGQYAMYPTSEGWQGWRIPECD